MDSLLEENRNLKLRLNQFSAQVIIDYDNERETPASEEVHSCIRKIMDKPHLAPLYIADLLEMKTMKENYNLWEEIEEVIRLAVHAREKEIDASCCQTKYDFDQMNKAQEKYEQAKENLEKKVKNL